MVAGRGLARALVVVLALSVVPALSVVTGVPHGAAAPEVARAQERSVPGTVAAGVSVPELDVSAHAVGPGSEATWDAGPQVSVQGTGDGLLFRAREDGATQVDYAKFRAAFGGDFATRLRVVEVSTGKVVPGRNDPDGGRITVDLTGPARPTRGPDGTKVAAVPGPLYALSAGTGGEAGSFAPTSLAPSATWAVGVQSGDFSWSYPIQVPPAPGPAPQVALSYSSGVVDGRTASTNNQASWVGEGFGYEPGFIERTYKPCAEDGEPGRGDLCWDRQAAHLVLPGITGELVWDAAKQLWRVANDEGWRVESRTGADNGDDDGEHWVVTGPDGTRYTFGAHGAAKSAWTVPVFGNDEAEPCHGPTFDTSWCHQAYRWTLDSVTDTHGDQVTYHYETETNHYGRAGSAAAATPYVRAGRIARIDYGHRAGTAPTGRVVFTGAPRCVPGSVCSPTRPADWPDTPWDLHCAGGGCPAAGPSFWGTQRLAGITTQVRQGDAYADVDSWVLDHIFPATEDHTSPALWLRSITRTGHVAGSAGLPPVLFDGVRLANRVGAVDGLQPMNKWRLARVHNETGGVIEVGYSTDRCDHSSLPRQDTNEQNCFPAHWLRQGASAPELGWFNKYVVGEVAESDRVGGAPRKQTRYEYVDAGPAWRYDAAELVPSRFKTWGSWRGFQKVKVRTGEGGAQTLTEHLFLRGMDDDLLIDGTRRNVEVVDSQNRTYEDKPGYAGFARETVVRDAVTGAEISAEFQEPWLSDPTAVRNRDSGPLEARILKVDSVQTRKGTRVSQTRTKHDEHGNVVEVHDLGDVAVADDDVCTTTTYARNTTAWIVNRPSRVVTASTPCGTTPTPLDVVSDDRTYYDGATSVDTPPTKGDVTRTERLAAWDGARPVYSTTARATHDQHGRVVESFDALDARTTTAHEPETGGPVNRVIVTNPLGHTTSTELDPARGQTVATVDAEGRRAERTLDPLGRVTAEWQAGRPSTENPSVRHEYLVRADGPAVVTTHRLQGNGEYATSHTLYDGLLRERQTQAPSPNGGRVVTDTLYDAHGRVSRTNNAYHHADPPAPELLVVADADVPSQEVVEYDGAGRTSAEALWSLGAERHRTTYTHGPDRVSADPPTGGTPTTEITDVRGRLVELRQYTGDGPTGEYRATTHGYTRSGLRSSVTDPDGNTWRFEHDLRGRQVRVVDPDKGVATMTHDDADRLTTVTDARGTTLTHAYDALGRRTAVSEGTRTLTEWTYDTAPGGLGQPASATRYGGGQAYRSEVLGYNGNGLPTGTAVTIPAREGALAGRYESTVDHDRTGQVVTTTLPAVGDLPAETLTTGHNALGMPTTLGSDLSQYVADTGFTGTGRTEYRVLGGRVTRVYGYDDATRRLTRATTVTEAGTAVDVTAGHDPAGNVVSLGDAVSGDLQCFRHDALRRLVDAWTSPDCTAAPGVLGGPAPYWHSYSYDTAGNRTREVRHETGTTRDHAYPAPGTPGAHRVTSVTTGTQVDSYGYDAAGNTVSRPGQALTWTAEGRLAEVRAGDAVTTFEYDAEGARLIRRDPTGSTLYLAGTEVRAAGGVVTASRHYAFDGTTVAVRTGAGVTWLVDDHAGTAGVAIGAEDLAVTTRRQFPFGGPRGQSPAWPGERGFVGPGATWAAPGRSGAAALRLDGREGHAGTSGPVAPRTPAATFDSFTAMGWVKLTELDGWAWAVSQDGRRDSGFTLGYSSHPRGWSFGMSGADADGDGGGGSVVADGTPQLGVWTHLAGVYDHTAGTITLYVNGKPVKSQAHRSTWYAEGALLVGRGKNDGRLTDFWPGEVDDVQLTPGASSAAEVVKAMAGPTFAPGGRWRLDDDATDATGHGHALALWNGASWTAGRTGAGLRLDGVSGHAHTAGPVVDPADSFTVAAWVKLDGVDRAQTVVSQDGSARSGFRLHHDKDAKAWVFTIAGNGTVPDGVLKGTSAPRAGEWTHLAGVHDRITGTMRLFVNGRLQATAPYTSAARAEQGLVVGRGRHDGWWVDHLAGVVDEVEVRQSAAQPADVWALSGVPPKAFEENQPVPLHDLATAESALPVIGLTPDTLAELSVTVELKHTYRGDLVLRLVAPDGTEYLLEDLLGGGDVDDFAKTYRFNASGEQANGNWKLRVEDKVLGDTGTLVRWSIAAPVSNDPPVSAPWAKVAGSSFTVGNGTTTERTVTVSGVPGKAPSNLALALDTTWSWASDLKVSLVSPDNKEHVLHDGSVPQPPPAADPCGRQPDPYTLRKTYHLNASTAPANGVWKLRIKHTSSSGAPTVNAWSLSSAINLVASATAPDTKFANPNDVALDGYYTSSPVTVCGVPGSAARDLRIAVDVRHPNRGDLRLELESAEGAMTHLLEEVPDTDTGDNVQKTYQVPGVAQLADGTWYLRVIDARDQWAGVINEWSVQLLPSPQAEFAAGWKAENTSDVPIVDDGWSESPITVDKPTGMAPKAWRVTVDLKHTHRGDLALYLEAPDGTGYLLEDLTGTADADDLAKSYTANASAERAHGVWKLKVLDAVWGDVGTIDAWSLSVAEFPLALSETRVPVADLATAESPLTATGAGNAPNGMQVQAAIAHPKPEQLVVTLVAPDASTYVLHDRKTVLPKLFRVDATSEALSGKWVLRVQDTASGEAGTIESWSLLLAPAVAWPQQRGGAFTVDSAGTGSGYARVSGIAGTAPTDLRLTVETSYYWVNELRVSLVAPDGTAYLVHDRASTMPGTFTVDASAEVANGLWKLSVVRDSSSGTVPITAWSLWSPVNQQATPSGPVTKFANGTDVSLPDDGWSAATSTAWATGVPGTEAKDLRVTVDVKHPNRGDLKLQLRAPDDAATYLLEDFPDNDTGDDVVKTYHVPGVAQVANGGWDLVVTDLRTGNTGTIDGFGVQVLSSPQVVLPAGWRAENGTDTSIPDYGVVDVPITVSGLTGVAPREWDVVVALKHTYRADLVLHLVAPDGTAYLLEDFAGTGDADDVTETYTVNASGEIANGVWKLRVRDRVWGDTGHVDAWSLAAAPTGTPTPAVAWPELRGSALKVEGSTGSVTGSSSVRVAGVPGNAPPDLRLSINTSYYWLSELHVSLTAPDGTVFVVHDHAATMAGTFTLDASAEVANGVWRLTVRRDSSSGTVDVTAWSLWSPATGPATPPGPVTKWANGGDVAIPDDAWATAESAVTVSGVAGNAPADLRVSVDVKHPNRGDLKLDLLAPDGSVYPLEDVPNNDTGDNVFKSYQVNGSAEKAAGTWRLRAFDAVTGNTGTIDGWSLQLGGLRAVAPGTRFENPTDVPVPDNGTAESTVSITGTTGSAPTGLRVGVTIRHPHRGDLELDLVAPDGTVYALENLTGSGDGDDVVTEYAVDAAAEPANGTWRLRVADSALGDTGTIDAWSLTFPAPTKYHNPDDVTVPDKGAPVHSVIAVSGRTSGGPLRVVVDVKHANRGDLKLDLVAPDGTVYALEDVPDGDQGDNVTATYRVEAAGEEPNGGWSLRVQDTVTGTSGRIDAWSLRFDPA